MAMKIKKSVQKGLERLKVLPFIGGMFAPRDRIAVLRLSGIISDMGRRQNISHARFAQSIEDAFEIHNLKAVVLAINSPGGSPAQSELIADHIRALAVKHDIPVYAFAEDVAASGGYWLACAADKIYAAKTSIVGSIGVISASFGLQDLIERHGVERRIHTSGKDKSFLDPFLHEKPDDVKRLKALQSELHETFKDWVRTRRGARLTGSEQAVFEGQFWAAPQALELGLIDGIGDVRTICRAEFGADVKFVDVSPDRGLVASLLSARGGGMPAINITRDLLETAEERSVWARFGL